MLKKIILTITGIFFTFISYQYFYGGNPKSVKLVNNFEVVAHRGVHQNYYKKNMNWHTTCTAKRIYKPTHQYLENTIESIQAAFDLGATIVEIDINRSSDNHIVLFHDWMLDCRTEAKGKVSDFPLDYLKTLDIGYGYTFDEGKTFPFRGKGIGKMPTLIEVLNKFPGNKFFIDHKDGSIKTAQLFIDVIKYLPKEEQNRFYYWGREKTFSYIKSEIPSIKRLFCNRKQMKKWFLQYLLTFGLSDFPKESEGYVFAMPPKYFKFLWGWPYRFLKKVHKANAKFYLMIGEENDAKKYADIPVDGIVTDYIEVVGKYFRKYNSVEIN
jgi:glycerophosphoryl diester phosphodiesterase